MLFATNLDKYFKEDAKVVRAEKVVHLYPTVWSGRERNLNGNGRVRFISAGRARRRMNESISICPTVGLTGSHSYFGRCCPRRGTRKYAEYDFYIEMAGWTLNNSEKNLRNTLIHELIHTVPGGLCHTGQWKKWAAL